ncbi:calcium-binding protein [Pseudaestuariivita atlantica]|uniref:Calcium-binding protein n=1 Tax=Pseudaestuariivita atlantica TaxID=1317121 RepID=A0A0L1JKE3_9RHOB|nr:calcium-binding protein [Pseudaestuariivita atlantica]KNG92229.1 hypothetical protein ATO11_18380 [Pseudaestuariivita atlantica]
MTRLSDYADALASITADQNAIDGTLDDLGLLASTGEVLLDQPRQLADRLEDAADAIDLPNVIVNVLGNLPYGIGFAIKQLNSVSNTVGFTIEQQEQVLRNLDTLWTPAQESLSAFGNLLIPPSLVNGTLGFSLDNRAEELALLANVFDGRDVPAETELAARMAAFTGGVTDWEAVKALLLAPVDALATGLGNAVDALGAALPDTTALTNTINSATAVFAGAAAIANDIYDSLNVNIELPFNITINLISAIETITDFVGFVQNIIEDFVLDILDTLGFTLNVFAPVQNQILSILDPVFDVIAGIGAAAASAISAVTDALAEFGGSVTDLLTQLADLVGFDTLFQSEEVVTDPDGGALVGTGGEEALFGGEGRDTLDGRGGVDFLFGDAGSDHMDGRSGADELFGGPGRDTLIGGLGDDYVHGGAAIDTAILDDAWATSPSSTLAAASASPRPKAPTRSNRSNSST